MSISDVEKKFPKIKDWFAKFSGSQVEKVSICLEDFPFIYKSLHAGYQKNESVIESCLELKENFQYVPEAGLKYGISSYIGWHGELPAMDIIKMIDIMENPLDCYNLFPRYIKEDKNIFLRLIERGGLTDDSVKDVIIDKFRNDNDIILKIIDLKYNLPELGDDVKKNRMLIMKIFNKVSVNVLDKFNLSVLTKIDIRSIVKKRVEAIGLFVNMKNEVIEYIKEKKLRYSDCRLYKNDWDVIKTSLKYDNYAFIDSILLANISLVKYIIPIDGKDSISEFRFYEKLNQNILLDRDVMKILFVSLPASIKIYFGEISDKRCAWISTKLTGGVFCHKDATWNKNCRQWECKTHWNKTGKGKNSFLPIVENDFWISILRKNRGILKYHKFNNMEIEFAGYKRISQIRKDAVFSFI